MSKSTTSALTTQNIFFVCKHTGNSRKRICIKSTTATKTKAHDSTSAAGSDINSIALAMLCSGWAFIIRSDVENSSSAIAESAAIVSFHLSVFMFVFSLLLYPFTCWGCTNNGNGTSCDFWRSRLFGVGLQTLGDGTEKMIKLIANMNRNKTQKSEFGLLSTLYDYFVCFLLQNLSCALSFFFTHFLFHLHNFIFFISAFLPPLFKLTNLRA